MSSGSATQRITQKREASDEQESGGTPVRQVTRLQSKCDRCKSLEEILEKQVALQDEARKVLEERVALQRANNKLLKEEVTWQQDKNKLLEEQVKDTRKEIEELKKKQERQDREERDLRRKLQDASITNQELLEKVKLLESIIFASVSKEQSGR